MEDRYKGKYILSETECGQAGYMKVLLENGREMDEGRQGEEEEGKGG